MTKFRMLLFLALGMGLWFSTILMGSKPILFLNIPSILLGLGIPALMMVGLHGKSAFSISGPDARSVLETWDRVIINAAVGLAIIGGIQALSMTSEPSEIGPPLAVATLTLFQAYTIRLFVITPLLQSVNRGRKSGQKSMRKAA